MALGRPPLPPGGHGLITARRLPPNRQGPRWQARARYRDTAGRVVVVSRNGRTKADATGRLKAHLDTQPTA